MSSTSTSKDEIGGGIASGGGRIGKWTPAVKHRCRRVHRRRRRSSGSTSPLLILRPGFRRASARSDIGRSSGRAYPLRRRPILPSLPEILQSVSRSAGQESSERSGTKQFGVIGGRKRSITNAVSPAAAACGDRANSDIPGQRRRGRRRVKTQKDRAAARRSGPKRVTDHRPCGS